ncbi:MAG TPA: serine hydrolase domain-containing protein [Allosphingosinicella sp.]|nr:serine hydrolase domain-containing protein [Allosphingosinicella sp.]
MLRILAAGALLLSTPSSASPIQSPAAAPPEAAARPGEAQVERLFQEWLNAFNSGDPATVKGFYARHLDNPNPVFALETARDTCGFAIERVEARSPTSMAVLLSERCLPGRHRARLELATDGAKIKALDLTPLALPGDGPIRAAVDIAGRLAARDEFAGTLLLVRGGETLLARSWGLADSVARTPMTLDTPMLLASAGKMFTAVAVLQLVGAGKIDLDSPLGRYLTDYPNAEMAKVTIRQLLTHRGGTGDIGILRREEGANRARVRTIADIVRLNGSRAPDFPPGTKEDYSNYGFVLVGAVIEKVTGTSYYDYVARHLFEPAGMKNSGFPDKDHLSGVAVGYTSFFGAEPKLVATLDLLPWRGSPAGGGVASANDIRRFFDALKGGKLLSPAMLKQATSPSETPWYGLGFVVQADDNPHWGHGGMSYGMDVALHYYPKDDTTFICMAARDSVCNRLIHAWHLRTYGPLE